MLDGNFLVVQWLDLELPLPGTQDGSPVWELKSPRQRNAAKGEKKKNKVNTGNNGKSMGFEAGSLPV